MNNLAFVPMEGLVRPFQQFPVFPAPTNLPPREVLGIVQVRLGGSGGTTTSFTLDGGGFITKENDQKFKEVDRKSTLVRVENEDDPDQFVELCRPDNITFKQDDEGKQKNPTKQSTWNAGFNPDHVLKSWESRFYQYDHPKDKTCKPPNAAPKRGCG